MSRFLLWLVDKFRKPAIKPVVLKPSSIPATCNQKPNNPTHHPILTSRQLPQCGVDLIKSLEGCRTSAYLDTRGIPTIGYGHTQGVRIGDTCTKEQAEAWLKFDVTWAWESICRNVRVQLTSNQAGGLLSFVYNLGSPQFVESSVLHELNAGNYGLVPTEMRKWIYETLPDKTRKVSEGLVNRRNAEANLFSGADWRVA